MAQIKLGRLQINSIPKTLRFTGSIINAVNWTDSLGENIVITSETGETLSKKAIDSTYRDAALYAYHYIQKKDSFDLVWKLYDFIKECPVDIKAQFIKNAFAVTDLNGNRQAEIWMMYKTACQGDVSPSDMKIIMYEGGKKYAIRGTNKVKVSVKEYVGGEYSLDRAFQAGPKVFREYAKHLWQKNIMETWE